MCAPRDVDELLSTRDAASELRRHGAGLMGCGKAQGAAGEARRTRRREAWPMPQIQKRCCAGGGDDADVGI
jgi:hypothetical protein